MAALASASAVVALRCRKRGRAMLWARLGRAGLGWKFYRGLLPHAVARPSHGGRASDDGGDVRHAARENPLKVQLKEAFPIFEVGGAGEDWQLLERPPPTSSSDLRRKGRKFTILTTASLPWRTGTAVNPTLRAAYLAMGGRDVTLVLPWLADKDQQRRLYPDGLTFETQLEQEAFVRRWLADEGELGAEVVAGLPLRFVWYSARFAEGADSIFPYSQSLTNCFPEECGFDVLILEEPEHLNWFYTGKRWPQMFAHVVGIVHTNYLDYVCEKEGSFASWGVRVLSSLVCLSYVDVNVKLSDVIMQLPNEVVCNCHGVREAFLRVGDACGSTNGAGGSTEDARSGCYFLGKALFTKGYGNLLDLLALELPPHGPFDMLMRRLRSSLDWFLGRSGRGGDRTNLASDGIPLPPIDCYGSGQEAAKIRERAISEGLMAEDDEDTGRHAKPLRVFPGIDHADQSLRGYTTFVNPSTSDVLCTATAEALAMGKRVVLARHPSNEFFEQNFPGRVFSFEPGDREGFLSAIQHAESLGPLRPMEPEMRRVLTWQAANERLFDAAAVRVVRSGVRLPRALRPLWRRSAQDMSSNSMQEVDVCEGEDVDDAHSEEGPQDTTNDTNDQYPAHRGDGSGESSSVDTPMNSLRPSSVAQARLGYQIHRALGAEPLGDFLRTMFKAGPEVEWRNRRLIGQFVDAWEHLRDTSLEVKLEPQVVRTRWQFWLTEGRQRRRARVLRNRRKWKAWEARVERRWETFRSDHKRDFEGLRKLLQRGALWSDPEADGDADAAVDEEANSERAKDRS